MTTAWVMLALTLTLVFVGAGLHVAGSVGWAQAFYVLASGTAGAAVVLLLEDRR